MHEGLRRDRPPEWRHSPGPRWLRGLRGCPILMLRLVQGEDLCDQAKTKDSFHELVLEAKAALAPNTLLAKDRHTSMHFRWHSEHASRHGF